MLGVFANFSRHKYLNEYVIALDTPQPLKAKVWQMCVCIIFWEMYAKFFVSTAPAAPGLWKNNRNCGVSQKKVHELNLYNKLFFWVNFFQIKKNQFPKKLDWKGSRYLVNWSWFGLVWLCRHGVSEFLNFKFKLDKVRECFIQLKSVRQEDDKCSLLHKLAFIIFEKHFSIVRSQTIVYNLNLIKYFSLSFSIYSAHSWHWGCRRPTNIITMSNINTLTWCLHGALV